MCCEEDPCDRQERTLADAGPSGVYFHWSFQVNNYLNLAQIPAVLSAGIKLWWDEKQPDRIHLIFGGSLFADADGGREGLRIVFSSNPSSADYNPANFNRCARLLHSEGRPAPAPVDEHSRTLAHRNQVISDAGASQVPSLKRPRPMSGADNGVFLARALPCPACACLVVDLNVHDRTCLARHGIAAQLIHKASD